MLAWRQVDDLDAGERTEYRSGPHDPAPANLRFTRSLGIAKSKWWLKVRAKRARVNIRFFSFESLTFTLEPFHSFNFTFARLAP